MQNKEIPQFIKEKQLVTVDILADPDAEDNAFNRGKNGLWRVNAFQFKKGFGDAEERLYLILESVGRKNRAYINIPYNPLVVRPEHGEGPSLAEHFREKMQVTRSVAAPRQARFGKPGPA